MTRMEAQNANVCNNTTDKNQHELFGIIERQKHIVNHTLIRRLKQITNLQQRNKSNYNNATKVTTTTQQK